MTIKDAIELAMNAGYNPDWNTDEKHLLDPSFWEYLGISLGWCRSKDGDPGQRCLVCTPNGVCIGNNSGEQMHAFIDCLIQGGSIEEYFRGIN